MKRIASKIAFYFFFTILLIFWILSNYVKKEFSDISFDQLLYSIRHTEGTSKNAISDGIIYVIVGLIICYIIYFLLYFVYKKCRYNYTLNIYYKKKKKTISILPFGKITKFSIVIPFILTILWISLNNYKLIDYYKFITSYSHIFEEKYINSKEVNVDFPKNKKNLIFIYVESLETSNTSLEHGGVFEKSSIPNLENIALENTNFSNTNKLGGALQIDGTGWTAGAIVGYSTGLPLKVPVNGNEYNIKNSFLPGSYSIGEILKDNGYNNYFMLGSYAKFGGRQTFFKKHGDYTFYDYKWAKKEKLIDKDYNVWWGYEDKKLFKFAKNKLKEISQNKEPFNFTMLTADTHFIDGYLDKSCDEVFDNHYANSFYCSDSMIGSFIHWIKEQDFYKDTVIVIVGDHLTMQNSFYDSIDPNYIRTTYNAIINSDIKPKKEKNRQFTSLDYYPTTLAALGCTIEGNRLGLGTNLYSSKQTLAEELGFELLDEELKKNSKFYNHYILGDKDYYTMKSKIKDKE